MNISEELQLSVFHEGLLLLLSYSEHEHVLDLLKEAKSSNLLIKEITDLSDEELQNKYDLEAITVENTDAWGKFLKELQIICRKYKSPHPIVLGSIIEIMNQLNWQEQIEIRKLLTFYLDTKEELAHLKIATAGTKYSYLESWRVNIIEEAQGYAAYKSKLA